MRLSLDGVGHRFGDAPWLFRDLELQLDSGRTYALVGPSGAGKSTLLALLAGWMLPEEGRITRPEGPVSWVLQNPTGAPRRQAVDLVAYPFLARGHTLGDAEHSARAILRRVGLERVGDLEFRFLSGGEAQRLMLARAIASAPALLLVDEPTAQLDRATAAAVNAVLHALASAYTIVVIATHDAATRASCSDVIDLGVPSQEAFDASARHPR